MRKTWIGKIMLFVCCLLMCTSISYAVGDDTDGTELQVAQPVVLQIQLGQQWAGTEFQLKTNAGLYPGTITVEQDGTLRTELGSSGTYSIRFGIWRVFPLKYFDALEPMHEKAGYGGLILHEKAGSGLERVLCGPVRALGRADRSGRGTGPPCDKTAPRAPEVLYGPAILRFLNKRRFKCESSSSYVCKAYVSMLL